MQLAQLNIAEAITKMDSPVMADFVNNTDRINAIAEESEGFVWRLIIDYNDDTHVVNAFNSDSIVANMSVWKNRESLFNYVYNSGHVEVFKRKKEWFKEMLKMHMVLWYVNDGHNPTIEEGKERLEYLQKHGESPYAFGFKSKYLPEDL
jgi:6-phosphogluconolactonase (cycloisomerase 2 family)|tara:strand:+ start:1391 stop:1837 length:447 start_codon:yes stop_codon:yes gene_type:complete